MCTWLNYHAPLTWDAEKWLEKATLKLPSICASRNDLYLFSLIWSYCCHWTLLTLTILSGITTLHKVYTLLLTCYISKHYTLRVSVEYPLKLLLIHMYFQMIIVIQSYTYTPCIDINFHCKDPMLLSSFKKLVALVSIQHDLVVVWRVWDLHRIW